MGSGDGPLPSRLGEDDSVEDISHQNVRLSRRQALRDEVFVNEQTKHRPGVPGRFKLNHDLSDHGPTPLQLPVLSGCPTPARPMGRRRPTSRETSKANHGVSADVQRRRGRVVRTYPTRRQLAFLLTRLFVAAILTARSAREATFRATSASTTLMRLQRKSSRPIGFCLYSPSRDVLPTRPS